MAEFSNRFVERMLPAHQLIIELSAFSGQATVKSKVIVARENKIIRACIPKGSRVFLKFSICY